MSDQKRLTDLAAKVLETIAAEEDQNGASGLLIGIGVGQMLGRGATEEDVRSICDEAIKNVLRMLTSSPP